MLDSGNNYSVISTLEHIDPNTDIIFRNTGENVGTAGGAQLAIEGEGIVKNLPAVYAPDTNISMISVQQLCNDRDAVVMFLKYGAVRIKLITETITYLNKIKQIA